MRKTIFVVVICVPFHKHVNFSPLSIHTLCVCVCEPSETKSLYSEHAGKLIHRVSLANSHKAIHIHIMCWISYKGDYVT